MSYRDNQWSDKNITQTLNHKSDIRYHESDIKEGITFGDPGVGGVNKENTKHFHKWFLIYPLKFAQASLASLLG